MLEHYHQIKDTLKSHLHIISFGRMLIQMCCNEVKTQRIGNFTEFSGMIYWNDVNEVVSDFSIESCEICKLVH